MRYFFLLALFLLAGCAAPQATASLKLSQLEPLPEVSATAVTPLRVVVAAIISPSGAQMKAMAPCSIT